MNRGRAAAWLSHDAMFLAVLVLAIALRVAFFTGFHGYDDALYVERAFALAEGDRSLPAGAWEARIGVVGPTALAYRAFGVTPVSTNLYPFTCSIAGIVVAFVIGRRLFGSREGVLAALMLALFPLDVLSAGQLFPTAPVILLAGAAFGLFLLAERDPHTPTYLASGACFGLTLVVHEGALMALAGYPVYLAVCRGPNRRHAWLLVGLGLGLAVDPLVHTLLVGDPLARLAAIRTSHAQMLAGLGTDVQYAGFNRTWIAEGLLRPFVERTFGLFAWVLAAACWLGRRAARASVPRALAVIVAAGTVWVLFGSTSPMHYSPMLRLPRYLAPLVLPGVWLLGWFVPRRTQRWGGALVAVLAVTSVACLAMDSGNQVPPYDQARDVLARAGATHVFADRPRTLRFAEGMRPSYRLEWLPSSRPPAGTFVVVRRRRAGDLMAGVSGAHLVAEVTAPMTPYNRVLGNGLVMRLLRATRPPERFVEYADKVEPVRLAIYRME